MEKRREGKKQNQRERNAASQASSSTSVAKFTEPLLSFGLFLGKVSPFSLPLIDCNVPRERGERLA